MVALDLKNPRWGRCMAGRVGFTKPEDPAFAKGGEDGSIVDVSTSTLTYQMVPLGGRRRAAVFATSDRPCQVVIEAPRVVEFGARTFRDADSGAVVSGISALDRFLQPLPANTRMEFDIVGIGVGKTEIVLESAGGGGLASMKASAKAESKVTISACRLKDLEFVNPYDDTNIRAAMARTKFTFKNIANVKLIDDPTIYLVESDIGLGNPIVLGRAFTEYSQQMSTVHDHIIRKTPPAARAASIVAIFGWDFEIVHQPLVGLQSGRFVFVDFEADPNDRNLTLEHEIGHAMGLGHTSILSIMNGEGISRVERFEADEIEKLNNLTQSGP